MSAYILHRTSKSDQGTFGVFSCDGRPLCTTCEDPWNDNKTGESCIPVGTYKCQKHNGKRYQGVWEVCDVPGRSAILIHAGNTIKDTRGCILVGRSFSTLGGVPSVTNSIATLEMLREVLPDSFTLTII